MKSTTGHAPRKLVDALIVLLFTVVGFAVMGYHPGLEDDGIYLSAVKADLQPQLYPHDADFFRLQLQATVFDRWISLFARVTRMPIAWAELFWQLLSLYAILWAAHGIAQKLFPERNAQWAGVAMLAAMFTLPVAGTALTLADQHLHPRTMATALILFAVDSILARKTGRALVLLAAAFLVHPIMAVLGFSFCIFLRLAQTDSTYGRLRFPLGRIDRRSGPLAAVFPLSWIFASPTADWRRALDTRTYYFLYKWFWYEWLGALGPLVLFYVLWRYAEKRGQTLLARFAFAVLFYGLFQQAAAMILLAPSALIRVTPFQPMRYLQVVYLFFALLAGCLLGRYVLRGSIWSWAIFLAAVNGGMLASQRAMFPASDHLELPGRAAQNPWLQAFAWIRQNTPADAYFALDPDYLAAPGEDYHSFRALAERSQLADRIKDAAVVTQVPDLAQRWVRETDAQAGWSRFGLENFEKLQAEFGVSWVLLSSPAPARLTCVWHNDSLAVCRIPGLKQTPR